MGLFRKKEKQVDNRLVTSINDMHIASFKCPHCMATLFEGYYLTIKIDKSLKKCPRCGGDVEVK